MLSSIPSPPSQSLPGIGIRYYGLLIALGVLAAVWLSRKRWRAAGHDPDEIADIAVWAVPFGLVGARLYHVVTDFNLYEGRPWYWPIEIWNGGLGIPGGIGLGIVGGILAARYYKIDIPTCADAMAPTILAAQAIGRLGNYFNQEVFGRPTTVPWALEIDPQYRPMNGTTPTYPGAETFHPTFAYEALWNLGAMGVLFWIDSKKILRPGKMLPGYLTAYFTGRFWVEFLRSDHANEILGLRVNTWTSLIMIVVGVVWLMWGGLLRPEAERGIKPTPWEPTEDDEVEYVAPHATVASGAAAGTAVAGSASGSALLGEDGVAEGGPEPDGPVAEVAVAEADEPETGGGVDPDEGS